MCYNSIAIVDNLFDFSLPNAILGLLLRIHTFEVLPLFFLATVIHAPLVVKSLLPNWLTISQYSSLKPLFLDLTWPLPFKTVHVIPWEHRSNCLCLYLQKNIRSLYPNAVSRVRSGSSIPHQSSQQCHDQWDDERKAAFLKRD